MKLAFLFLLALAACRHAPMLSPVDQVFAAHLALVKCEASPLGRRCVRQRDALAAALDRYATEAGRK
jgi:hypothetical protein